MKKIITVMLSLILALGSVNAFAGGTELEKIIFQNDMHAYSEGTTKLGGFVTGTSGAGYIKAMTVDESYGRSLVIGSGAENNGYGTYAGIKVIGQGRITAEFDAYFSGIANSFTLWLRRSSGGVFTMGHIRSSEIALYGGTTETFPYEEGKWYRLKYVFDLSALTYDFYMTESENSENIDEFQLSKGKALDAACAAGLENLRIVASNQETDGFAAIDNIKTYMKSSVPEIVSFGYDETESADKIIYNPQRLCINLSSPVSSETVSDEYISCVSELGDEAVFEEITLSADKKTITCRPADSFYSNLNYKVTLSEKMKADIGVEFGEEVTGEFTVREKPLDVTNASFSLENGVLTVKPRVVNSSGDSTKMLWIVIARYNGNELKSVTAERFNASKRLSTPSYTTEYETGDTVEVYALDSMVYSNLINSKIYQFKN